MGRLLQLGMGLTFAEVMTAVIEGTALAGLLQMAGWGKQFPKRTNDSLALLAIGQRMGRQAAESCRVNLQTICRRFADDLQTSKVKMY